MGIFVILQLFFMVYYQCRWNYKDEVDVVGVDVLFDEYDILYDIIWFDIEYIDGKKYFIWDWNLFFNFKEMQNKFVVKGCYMVIIVDFYVKRDDNFFLYKEVIFFGYYVKDVNG